jgi:hypothetical protein
MTEHAHEHHTGNAAAEPVEHGTLSTETVTYRGYAKLDDKGAIDQVFAKAQGANDASWKKLEAAGHSQFNENEFIRYNVKDDAGFRLLVPSAEQRAYIIQSGLNYIQNAKANAFVVAVEEDGLTPKYNNQTIDLKEAINEAPSRRSLTDEEKLQRTIDALGLDDSGKALLLEQLAARLKS